MKRLALFVLLLSPGLVRADAAADVARLTAAIEAEDCTFTVDNGARIAEAAELDQDGLLAAVNTLFAQGLVEVASDGSMHLLTAPCK